VPHNFVTSYVWELPFGNGRNIFPVPEPCNFLIGGWQVQDITTTIGCAVLGTLATDRDNTAVSQMPDAIAAPVVCWKCELRRSSTFSEPQCRSSASESGGTLWPCRHRHATANSGRNLLYNNRPPTRQSLYKSSRITEYQDQSNFGPWPTTLTNPPQLQHTRYQRKSRDRRAGDLDAKATPDPIRMRPGLNFSF